MESTRTTELHNLTITLTDNRQTFERKRTHKYTHKRARVMAMHARSMQRKFIKVFFAVIQSSCCAHNELTTASVGSCTQYRLPHKKYHCLSKVKQGGSDVALFNAVLA